MSHTQNDRHVSTACHLVIPTFARFTKSTLAHVFDHIFHCTAAWNCTLSHLTRSHAVLLFTALALVSVKKQHQLLLNQAALGRFCTDGSSYLSWINRRSNICCLAGHVNLPKCINIKLSDIPQKSTFQHPTRTIIFHNKTIKKNFIRI